MRTSSPRAARIRALQLATPVTLIAMLAHAGDDGRWSDAFIAPGTDNGIARCMVRYNGDLVVGGWHLQADIGPDLVLRFRDGNWERMGEGIGYYSGYVTPPSVFDLEIFQGDLYASGRLDSAGVHPSFGIARWDGSQWWPLPGDEFRAIYAMEEFEDQLVVTGEMYQVDGLAVERVARWSGTEWSPMGSLLDYGASDLIVYQGELYAAGHFCSDEWCEDSQILKRWSGTAWDSVAAGDGWVTRMTEFQGELVLAGDIHEVEGAPAQNIVAWNGTSWRTLGGGLSRSDGDHPDAMMGLAKFAGDLIVSGDFDLAGGVPVSGIARWDGAQWTPIEPGIESEWDRADFLLAEPDTLYVGGSFGAIGGVGAWNVARWDGQTFRPWRTGEAVSGSVEALTVWGGHVVAGGWFDGAGSVPSGAVMMLDGESWRAFGHDQLVAVHDFEYHEGQLVAAQGTGFFGVTQHVMVFDGADWVPLGDGEGFGDGEPLVLLSLDGVLYAGGYFQTVDDVPLPYLARWIDGSWSGFGAPSDPVFAFAGDTANLYVGGEFTSVDGIPANNVARWNGSSWSSMGAGTPGPVFALAMHDGDLLAGGRGTGVGFLLRWNGLAWVDVGASPDWHVCEMVPLGTDLYVGGGFTTIGGITANHIARWDGSVWSTFGSGLNGAACALLPRGDLYVGGNFTMAGGKVSLRFARWDADIVATPDVPVRGGLRVDAASPMPVDGGIVIRSDPPGVVSMAVFDVAGRQLGSTTANARPEGTIVSLRSLLPATRVSGPCVIFLRAASSLAEVVTRLVVWPE